MTKQDLVDKVANRVGLTKADAGRSLEATLDSITSALASGEKVTVTGFGTFEVRNRQARMGRNPQTGEPIHIAATKVPHFKAGKGLKEAVR